MRHYKSRKQKGRYEPERCRATGKISLKSKAIARRKLREYDDIVRYYQCHHCDGYHLTSKEYNEEKP